MKRLLAVVGLTVIMLPVGIPAEASVEGAISYLEQDDNGRYRPVLEEAGSKELLADIDSITPPAISPDGSQVAFSGSLGDESLGLFAIFVVDSNGSGLTQVTSGSFAEKDPAWSPDGRYLVFSQNATGSILAGDCCKLARVELQTGSTSVLTANIGAVRPSYSPDGSLIVFDTPAGVWSMASGGGTATLRAAGGHDATFSPDSGSIAYVSSIGLTHQLRSVTLGGAAPSTLYSTVGTVESPVWSGSRIYFIEYSGLGYDGRTNVALRSTLESGSDLRTEQSFGGVVVGLSIATREPATHSVGNVDGDANSDLIVTGPLNQSVLRSNGGGFVEEVWGDLSPRQGWKTHLEGDFTGNGLSDIASYFLSDGTWHLAVSTGNEFSTSLWADFTTASGWSSQVVGDFDGDGRDDIANFHPSNGSWWVSRSTGSGFSTSLWAD